MKLFYFSYFIRLVHDVLVAETRTLIANIEANEADYPLPQPTLAIMSDAVDTLAAFGRQVSAGILGAIAARDKQRLVVLGLIQAQFGYLELCCASDRSMAAKLGVPLIKIRGKKPPMEGVNVPRLLAGKTTGELVAVIDYVMNRELYIFRITTNPSLPVSEWKGFPGKRVRHTFKDLTPGVLYTMCVEAIGKDGQTLVSSHISKWAA